MSNYACFLITVLYETSINLSPDYQLLKCALKLDKDKHPRELFDYPMEFRGYIRSLLPLHVKECGPIVEIQEIFEIHGDC